MGYDTLSLVRLWQITLRNFRLATTIVVLSISLSLVIAFALPPTFRSVVLLTPSRYANSENMASGVSGGALSVLRGLQSPRENVTAEALAILQSREFLERYIGRHNLLPILFADRWNNKDASWVGAPPILEDGYLRFSKSVLKVRADDETGFVKVQVEFGSAQLASEWANDLVEDLNNEIRERVVAEGTTDLKYLHEKMAEAVVPEVRVGIANLALERTKEVMLATNRESYAFRVLERAVPSKYRYYPKRALILIGGFIIGVLLSIACISIREAWRAQQPK